MDHRVMAKDAWRRTSDHAIMQALAKEPDTGIVILDAALRVTQSSVAAARFHGLTIPPRARWADLVPADDTAGEAVLQSVFSTGVPVMAHTQPMRAEDDLLVSMSVLPLRAPSGPVEDLLLVLRDITQQTQVHKAAAAIASSLSVLKTAQRLASECVALGIGSRATVNLAPEVWAGTDPPLRRPRNVGLVRAAIASADNQPWPDGFLLPDSPLPRLPETEAVQQHLRGGTVRLTSMKAITAALGDDPDLIRQLIPGRVRGLIHCPLIARGKIFGSLEVWRREDEPEFTDRNVETLLTVAEPAALSFDNSRLYERERAANERLQRSLLPAPSARSLAADAEGIYLPTSDRPGAGAGGDWFDAIPLSGGRVCFVVGDVVGHGLHATAAMARLRTAVTSLADIELPPDELLTHLDDLVLRLVRAEDDSSLHESVLGSTCLVAIYDPVARRCAMASAGHPPPVLVQPDGTATLVKLEPGPPLGIGGLPFEVTEIPMPPTALLALYTDGLIQHDRGDIGIGIETLRVHLERMAPTTTSGNLRTTAERLVKTVTRGDPLLDDVTLLLARIRAIADDNIAAWPVPDDPAAVSSMRNLATRQLTAWSIADDLVFIAELVVSELVTNAVRYGSGPDALRLIRDGNALVVEVSDHSHSHPHLRRARRDDEGGRGLGIVAQLVDRWGSRYTRSGKTMWAEIGANVPQTYRSAEDN